MVVGFEVVDLAEDFEVEDLGVADLVEDTVAVLVVVEDPLEELVLHGQHHGLQEVLTHMGIIDHIIGIIVLGGIIIDHGIIDGGTLLGGQDIIIVLGITPLCILGEEYYL